MSVSVCLYLERLWSSRDVNSVSMMEPRLASFRCLLHRRGISSSPLQSETRMEPDGPGGCDAQWISAELYWFPYKFFLYGFYSIGVAHTWLHASNSFVLTQIFLEYNTFETSKNLWWCFWKNTYSWTVQQSQGELISLRSCPALCSSELVLYAWII